MKSWYSRVSDIELKDGSIRTNYVVTFETDNFKLKREVEKYLQGIMDKTEPNNSEKPNNCKAKNYCDDCLYTDTCDSKEFFYACTSKATISKMEQVEDEPQTDWHYDEQDATWYPYKHEDEPQQKSCATCKHALGNWDGESNNCGRCCGADRRFYEPKDEPQTCEDCRHNGVKHAYDYACDKCTDMDKFQHEDEPQTDCPWMKGE